MHYCFLTISTLDNAGLMRARDLGKALVRRGVRVSYVVDDNPVNRAFDRLDPAARVEFIADARRGPGQIGRRRAALKRLAPDYVEVLNPHVKTLLPLARLRGPKVVAMWDEPPTMKPLGGARGLEARLSTRWLARRADVHLAATRTLREALRRRHGIDAAYMPHAAYLPEYPPTTSPYDRPTLAYMGNLFPLWDHDVILHAARLLADAGKRPPVVLMGSGPDEAKWQAFLDQHRLDNVKLLGHTTGLDLWRRLRHAHALLFPIRETLTNLTRCPSKTFAYAQARRPTITNRVGEVAEVLGDAATYVDCTPEAFAAAMARAVETPDLPDVDYHVERQSWDLRADALLKILNPS